MVFFLYYRGLCYYQQAYKASNLKLARVSASAGQRNCRVSGHVKVSHCFEKEKKLRKKIPKKKKITKKNKKITKILTKTHFTANNTN
jgi:hypothetical protein